MILSRPVLMVLAVAALGCASTRTREADARALAAADAKVLEGCYDCLLEARAVYEQFADGRGGPSVILRLFETDLLLVLREKELALNWQPSMDRARAVALRVSPALEPQRLLAVVDAVLPDERGVPLKTRAALRGRQQAFIRSIPAELSWLDTTPMTPVVRQYLALALDCSYEERARAPGETSASRTRRRDPTQDAPPLVLYRIGICTGQNARTLERTRLAALHFIEVAYYLGRIALDAAAETGGDDARSLLMEAYARFPRSPGVTYALGQLYRATDDCAQALRFLDETLVTEPLHERALLDRTICLTNEKRNAEAIESATRMIALRTSVDSLAYYWRAVNRLVRKELELARSDIEVARTMGATDEVLTIAGVIEHDQDDLAPAEADLRRARAMFGGETNCTAAFYLGRVMAKRERWTEAAAGFEQSMACYDRRVTKTREKIAEMRATPELNPEFRARRIARLEATIEENRSSYFASAFNAANNNARGGNFPRAREMLDIAAKDSSLATEVARLREALKGLPPPWF